MITDHVPIANADRIEISDLSDAELTVHAQSDVWTIEHIYIRFLDTVLGYCYRRLWVREEAEDAASSVFLKALRGLPGFSDRQGSFRSWLFTIAHHEINDRLKYWHRHQQSPLEHHLDAPCSVNDPEEIAIESDQSRYLRQLISLLPERERAVIELRLSDLDTAEIATVLGLREQNVRTIQCRAIARLREQYPHNLDTKGW